MEPIPQGLRERKKRQTRLELARAAVRLFEERGYDDVTIDDIAAEANVSRRTFFRYFESKDEVFIVDPEGKIAAMRIALREGPPEESTLDALRRGALALMSAYFDSELSLAVLRLVEREPRAMAAAMAYQVRLADSLAHELAIDLGTDERLDPRPRILAHASITLMRAAVANWLADRSLRTPVELAEEAFDRGRPALEAILELPTGQSHVSAA
ncbi:MAG: TetR family transcriptional regulator [Candidatus Limnocylindrales bacterium]